MLNVKKGGWSMRGTYTQDEWLPLEDLLPEWWLDPRRRLLYRTLYQRNHTAQVSQEKQERELQLLDSQWRARSDKIAALGNTGMDWLFLGCGVFNTAVGIVALATGNVAPALQAAQVWVGMGWNYGDGVGGYANAFNQIHYKEYIPAAVNAIASTQLIALTTLSYLATQTLNWGATAAAGLSGFAFAACMFASCLLEIYEIYKCDKNIKKLTEEKKQLEDQRTSTPNSSPRGIGSKLTAFENALALEQAKRRDHVRNAKSWLACGLVMTAIAAIGFIAASGATAGALPAIIVAVTLMGVAVGCVRKHWANRINYVQKLKDKQEHFPGDSMGWDAKLKPLVAQGKITKEEQARFIRLLEHHPVKAKRLLRDLKAVPTRKKSSTDGKSGESPSKYKEEQLDPVIQRTLKRHQDWYGRFFGSTKSWEIWNQDSKTSTCAGITRLFRR